MTAERHVRKVDSAHEKHWEKQLSLLQQLTHEAVPGTPGWGSLSKIWQWVLRDFDQRVNGLARHRSNCTVHYRPVLSSERKQTRNCLKEISRRKKNWSRVLDGCLTPRQAGRLTVGRKLTSTSTSTHEVTSKRLVRTVFRRARLPVGTAAVSIHLHVMREYTAQATLRLHAVLLNFEQGEPHFLHLYWRQT
jgi:hypothetical protein